MPGTVTRVIGSTVNDEEEASIVSWSDTQIVAEFGSRPTIVTVHSVHGSIDILVKVELTRDLLSSDAEVIGQYVHSRVRQIDGILSTQTLIPGTSHIKD